MNASNRASATDHHQTFAWLLVFVFAVVSLIGVRHHEMWRDELQAWTLARDSSSLADLWQNMRPEPHPMLWHTLLFFLTRVTRNPVAMQYLHWLIAVAAVCMFVAFSRFSMLQKALFCFGYYPLYEYSAIARNYSLGMLLVFLFCALLRREPRNYIALALVVGLLSCAHFYDVPIAWTLAALLVFDYVGNQDEREHLRQHPRLAIVGIGVVVSCQAFVAVQLWRCAGQKTMETSPGLHLRNVWIALTWMWRMFFPIPLIDAGTFGWNTNLWADTSQVRQDLAVVFSGTLVIVFLVLFWWRSRRAFLLYALGTLLLLMTQFTIGFGSLRHMGKYYLVLLASYWIATDASPSSPVDGPSARGRHLLSGLVTTILVIHVVAGGICYWIDLRTVFSAAKPTVRFLRDNHLAHKLIAVAPDAPATSISGYLGRKVYAADSKRMVGFTPEDRTYYANLDKPDDVVVREVLGMLSDATNQIVLITRSRLVVAQGQNSQPLEALSVPPDRRIIKLAQFPESITDEKFFVYLVEKLPTGRSLNPLEP